MHVITLVSPHSQAPEAYDILDSNYDLLTPRHWLQMLSSPEWPRQRLRIRYKEKDQGPHTTVPERPVSPSTRRPSQSRFPALARRFLAPDQRSQASTWREDSPAVGPRVEGRHRPRVRFRVSRSPSPQDGTASPQSRYQPASTSPTR